MTIRSAVSPMGQRDSQRRKRATQAGEMARFLDQRAVADLADFVDPVAEGEGAIVDRHRSLGDRNVLTIDIGDARHGRPSRKVFEIEIAPASARAADGHSTLSDLSLRCSAERSMPMNSAVREMLPPKRLI